LRVERDHRDFKLDESHAGDAGSVLKSFVPFALKAQSDVFRDEPLGVNPESVHVIAESVVATDVDDCVDLSRPITRSERSLRAWRHGG
jgi:hypothetical protein